MYPLLLVFFLLMKTTYLNTDLPHFLSGFVLSSIGSTIYFTRSSRKNNNVNSCLTPNCVFNQYIEVIIRSLRFFLCMLKSLRHVTICARTLLLIYTI